jgi:DNA-binding NtrC family response regulator
LLDYFKSTRPGIPIILYTGLIHDPRQVASMLQRGASSYVNKAQPIEALLSAIYDVRNASTKKS